MNTLEKRLSALEDESRSLRRRVRGLQGALAGVALLSLSSLLLGDAVGDPQNPPIDWDAADKESVLPPVAEVIRAHRFEVVGKDERKFVAAMGTTPEGGGFVETWTSSDRRSARLGSASPDGTGILVLYDAASDELFRASAAKGYGGQIVVGGTPGRFAARLQSNERGDGHLVLANHGGFEIASLGGQPDSSSGSLFLTDESGHRLARVGKADRGNARLELYNDFGARLFDLTVDESRTARMTAANAEGLVVMKWPELPPVEDRGDLPPAPAELGGTPAPAPPPPLPANAPTPAAPPQPAKP